MKVNPTIEKPVVWTALITPLNEKGDIDFDSLLKLLKEQEKASHGILILGSTGEALNLSTEEKKEVLNFCFKQKLKALLCAVFLVFISLSTLEWIQMLETQPIDCYLMVTPLYAKPGDLEQYHWFKTLLDAATRPTVLYNVPSRAGAALSLEALSRLKDHPQFGGIKEASGSVQEFIRYRDAAPGKKMFSGDDAMMEPLPKRGQRSHFCGLQ